MLTELNDIEEGWVWPKRKINSSFSATMPRDGFCSKIKRLTSSVHRFKVTNMTLSCHSCPVNYSDQKECWYLFLTLLSYIMLKYANQLQANAAKLNTLAILTEDFCDTYWVYKNVGFSKSHLLIILKCSLCSLCPGL